MLGRLFLLFTLVPLAEIYLLIAIGGYIGALPTFALVVVTGMLGAHLARREGRRALAGYQKALSEGRLPEEGVLSGLLILLGGVLLITPGVLTDVAGLALMVPPVRRAVARRLEQQMQKRLTAGIDRGTIRVISFGGFSPGAGHPESPFRGRGEVIDVEAHENVANGADTGSTKLVITKDRRGE